MSKDEMFKACLKISKINEHLYNKDDEHRLMINVSRGLLGIYHEIKELEKGPNIDPFWGGQIVTNIGNSKRFGAFRPLRLVEVWEESLINSGSNPGTSVFCYSMF